MIVNVCPLTVHRCEVFGQVCGGRPLHEQFSVGVSVTGHQMVILRRGGTGRWRRQTEQTSVLQMLVGHCVKQNDSNRVTVNGTKTVRPERLLKDQIKQIWLCLRSSHPF